jgi:hypothetical protein
MMGVHEAEVTPCDITVCFKEATGGRRRRRKQNNRKSQTDYTQWGSLFINKKACEQTTLQHTNANLAQLIHNPVILIMQEPFN